MAAEPDTDENLMLRYAGDDHAAFEALYHRYRSLLFNYLLRQCRHRPTAEELYQDIWLRLIAARQRYRPTARFKTFLFTLVHNRLVDHYRKQSTGLPQSYIDPGDEENNPAVVSSITPEQINAGRQQLEQLMALVEALPAAQREAFLLREHAGLGVDEIARVTGVEPETAKSRLRYAFNKLRKAMES